MKKGVLNRRMLKRGSPNGYDPNMILDMMLKGL